MDKKVFLEKVWNEVFCGENIQVNFNAQCLADTTVDGQKITCDGISFNKDGVNVHDATKSKDAGWYVVSADTLIYENLLEDILCSINHSVLECRVDGVESEEICNKSDDTPWILVSAFIPDFEENSSLSPKVLLKFKDGDVDVDQFDWKIQKWIKNEEKKDDIVAWMYIPNFPLLC